MPPLTQAQLKEIERIEKEKLRKEKIKRQQEENKKREAESLRRRAEIEQRRTERINQASLEAEGKRRQTPSSGGLNIQDRLELERARARGQGGEIPIIRDDRVVTPSTLEAEAKRERKQTLKDKILEDPASFGLDQVQAQELLEEELAPQTQEGVTSLALQEQERRPLSTTEKFMNLAFGNVLEIDTFTGERRIDPNTGRPVQVQAGVVPIGGAGTLKVGGKVIVNPKQAIQTAKGLQIVKRVKDFLIKNGKFASVGALGGVGFFISGKVTKLITEGKIDERQQSLNTAGQEATTIVGAIKTGQIDPAVGLRELKRLEQYILDQDRQAKGGASGNLAFFETNFLDFNADVQDALNTIIEARADIFEFRATGISPEINPFELNLLLRELEAEGLIEKVQFAPFVEGKGLSQ